MGKRGQAAVELIVILAMGLIIMLVILKYSQEVSLSSSGRFESTKAKSLINDLADAAELVYQQGFGSRTKLYVMVPDNVQKTNVSGRTISMRLSAGGKDNDVFRNLDFAVTGSIPKGAGNYWIYVESKGDFVEINVNISDEIEICYDTVDNDNDGDIDCDDDKCIGQIGPNGGVCCDGDDDNCAGVASCHYCDTDLECSFNTTTTICDNGYLCSDSGTGNDAYGDGDKKNPSRGYCDGTGNCDFGRGSSCSLGRDDNSEGTGLTICVDTNETCQDTCTDTFDNDNDGCADAADSNCGATETICDDTTDNDCDGATDCDDSDCNGQPGCVFECSYYGECSSCISAGCEWCDGWWIFDSHCEDECIFWTTCLGTCKTESC